MWEVTRWPEPRSAGSATMRGMRAPWRLGLACAPLPPASLSRPTVLSLERAALEASPVHWGTLRLVAPLNGWGGGG